MNDRIYEVQVTGSINQGMVCVCGSLSAFRAGSGKIALDQYPYLRTGANSAIGHGGLIDHISTAGCELKARLAGDLNN